MEGGRPRSGRLDRWSGHETSRPVTGQRDRGLLTEPWKAVGSNGGMEGRSVAKLRFVVRSFARRPRSLLLGLVWAGWESYSILLQVPQVHPSQSTLGSLSLGLFPSPMNAWPGVFLGFRKLKVPSAQGASPPRPPSFRSSARLAHAVRTLSHTLTLCRSVARALVTI